jgi:hypothetical protein
MRKTSVAVRPTLWIASGYGRCTVTACRPLRFGQHVKSSLSEAILRHRQMLIQYSASYIHHMQKAMTQMNLQLHHVISDITGLTGMKIVRAIVNGERDATKLAAMRHESIHASAATIEKALTGDYRPEHLFTLKQSLDAFDHYQKQIGECDQQIAEHVRHLGRKPSLARSLRADEKIAPNTETS